MAETGIDVQIIQTPSGDTMVVMPMARYEALLAASHGEDEDALDIALYDARKQEMADSRTPVLPPDVSLAILKGASRLAALRHWRGLGQGALAREAGIAQGYLSDLERGRRSGSRDTTERLALALDVPNSWLN